MRDFDNTSIVDLLTGSLPLGYLERVWPGAVRLVVVDTNVILLSLRRFMRDGTSAMLGAAKRGTLKLFAAEHVYWEVLEKIPLKMPGWGFAPEAAVNALDVAFLPWIRFVNLGGTGAADGRDLLVGDLDDRPTVALLSLLAPAVSLSRDPDLVAVGLAFDEWLTPLLAGARRGELADMAFTANLGLNVTVAGTAVAANAARRWPTVALFFGALGAIYAAQRVASGRMKLDAGQIQDQLRGLVEAAGEQLETVFEQAREQGLKLDAATVRRLTPPGLDERIAHMLALEPRARSHVDLAGALSRTGVLVTSDEALKTLQSHPFFEREGRWGWRVGRITTLPDR